MTGEEVKKYLPYAIPVGIIIIGIYLYSKRTQSTDISYRTVAPSDVSNQVATAAQIQMAQIEASTSGFISLVDYLNNDRIADYNLTIAREQNARDIELARIDSNNQMAQIRSVNRQSRDAKQTQAISAIASIATAFILFCYDTTIMAQRRAIPYLHGVVDYGA